MEKEKAQTLPAEALKTKSLSWLLLHQYLPSYPSTNIIFEQLLECIEGTNGNAKRN